MLTILTMMCNKYFINEYFFFLFAIIIESVFPFEVAVICRAPVLCNNIIGWLLSLVCYAQHKGGDIMSKKHQNAVHNGTRSLGSKEKLQNNSPPYITSFLSHLQYPPLISI